MILVDTGPLQSIADVRDSWRPNVLAYLAQPSAEVRAIPMVVLGELGYALTSRLYPAQEAEFLRDVAQGPWALEPSIGSDLIRAADLVEQYADFPLGTVDALIVAMAERLGVTTIFTLDRRHFGAVKPAHCERFEIVP